jgi:hypothetical protein
MECVRGAGSVQRLLERVLHRQCIPICFTVGWG